MTTETPPRVYFNGDESRYGQAARQIAETQGNIWTERDRWKKACFVCLAVMFVLAVGLVWFGRQPSHIPVYVKVNSDGQFQVLNWDAYDPTLEEIKGWLILWIRCVRGVPTDRGVLERCWQIVPLYLLERTQARSTVAAYFAEMKPGKTLFERSIEVRDVKPVREPDGRWRVTWKEDVYALPKGGGLGKWERSTDEMAILILTRQQPKKKAEIELNGENVNPLGLRITHLAWGQ
jgi:type IV secretory pathway TrbF-like protein